jgi:hypothetical protein
MNPILQQAGLLAAVGDRITGGDVQFVIQGGSVLLYITDDGNRAAIEQRVRKALANVAGIEKIVSSNEFADYGIADPKHDPHAPDMVLFAKLGYFFGDTAAGGKKEIKGSHGYDSHLPDMRAVFVACGAGIQPGAKLGVINNTSVAPTVASLLNLEIPNAEGKPLVDALSN